MLHQLTHYINFLLNSTNQHGVHSPFVYNLTTKCFYNKQPFEAYTVLNKFKTKKITQLIFKLSNYFKPNNCLELGNSSNLITIALNLGSPNCKLTVITNLEKTKPDFNHNLNNTHLNHNLNAFLNTLKAPLDLVFINNTYTNFKTLSDFKKLLSYCHNNTVLIFESIYNSKTQTNLWNSIKQHPKVTVTVDTFYFGLVFFRKEQAKQHFKIKL